MNEKQLQAIKDRAEKATLGPWFIDGAIDVHSAQGNEVAAVWDGGYDIEFIAHAREDIPQLVAEVERCHVEIADREQSHIDLYNDYQKAKSKFESLVQALHEIYLHADDEDMIIEMIHNALYNEEETKQ